MHLTTLPRMRTLPLLLAGLLALSLWSCSGERDAPVLPDLSFEPPTNIIHASGTTLPTTTTVAPRTPVTPPATLDWRVSPPTVTILEEVPSSATVAPQRRPSRV